MKYQLIDTFPIDNAYLHFDAVRTSQDKVQIDYELILPHRKADCRGTWVHKGRKVRPKSICRIWLDFANNRHIPLGRTIVGTKDPVYPFTFSNDLALPFRDGVHQSWDNKLFGGRLQVIYTMDNKHYLLSS